jgi:hypothetical protein
MEKKVLVTPSAFSASANGCARTVEVPTTMSARVPPIAFAAAGTRFSASPRPKTMRPAEANSKGDSASAEATGVAMEAARRARRDGAMRLVGAAAGCWATARRKESGTAVGARSAATTGISRSRRRT